MIKNRVLIIIIFISFVLLECNSDNKDIPSSTSKSFKEKEYILLVAKKKIDELKLNKILLKSKLAIVCYYKKKGILPYDSIGILNFQLNFIPIVILKGAPITGYIYIHVHSPGLSGFGHEENYGKKFLIFLTEDKFEDGHYSEGMDFIRAVILE